MTILIAVLMFGILVFVHEAGHFLTARAFGIKIHEFALGMGPAIFKKEKNNVTYSLRAVPIGGFVKLEGEDVTSDDPRAFNNKPPLARIAVLLAGGIMNIITGFLVFVLFYTLTTHVNVPVVDRILPDTPAETAGLAEGDRILSINGRKVNIQSDVSLSLYENRDNEARITVLRNGQKLHVKLKPMKSEEGNYLIGFTPTRLEMTPGLVIKNAYYNTFFVVRLVYFSIAEMIKGNIGIQDISGPVGIVSEISRATKSNEAVLSVLNFVALIAVNLGVMNLLPLPALDGGRIFFALVELIRRKPVKPEHEGIVHFVGFALLILLMIAVTFSDFAKMFA